MTVTTTSYFTTGLAEFRSSVQGVAIAADACISAALAIIASYFINQYSVKGTKMEPGKLTSQTTWTCWHTESGRIFHMIRPANAFIWSNADTVSTAVLANWFTLLQNVFVALITLTANLNATQRWIRLRQEIKNARNECDGLHKK